MTEISTAKLAAEVNVSRQMIAKWAAEGLESAAKLERGKWDREAALTWISDRREDTPPGGASPGEALSLTAQRTALYAEQTEYQKLRNGVAKNVLMYRDTATRAVNEYAAAQISDVDAWARDISDEAAAVLLGKGLSAAEVIKVKGEVARGFRRRQSDLVRRLDNILYSVEDVGASRIRVSGSMGGR